MFANVDQDRIINTDYVAYIETYKQEGNEMLYVFRSESKNEIGRLYIGENDHQKKNTLNAILNNGRNS